jgi:hypothetical protein
MTADEYEAAKTRHAALERKLEARTRIGEGYTTNAREIQAEVDRLAVEIADHEAALEGEG